MQNKDVRFIFTLSEEGIEQYKEGNVTISAGGLRKPDGTLYEMARPVLLESPDTKTTAGLADSDDLLKQLAATKKNDSLILDDLNTLKECAWLNFSLNKQIYEMTYQGFQMVIGQLNDISDQISDVKNYLNSKDASESLELLLKYKNQLIAIAGHLETKNFNVNDKFLEISGTINDVHAYLIRLYNELRDENKDHSDILRNIALIIKPYTYVVRKISALYYFENELYPSNYADWIEIIEKIINDEIFKTRLLYFLRTKGNLSFEKAHIANNAITKNIQECLIVIRQIKWGSIRQFI